MNKFQNSVDIPDCYVWLTEGARNRPSLFKRYVIGYLKITHPELELIKIDGMKAVCKKK
ncbi:hypothetical protein ACTHHL_12095 [Aeribacillus composti]|uniref:Uncharacterized protein n=1 Tax=Anoxybacillus phage A403 TaxID=2099336 RepID=A0A2P1JTZ9_9CAUD|nr:hypothetical protein HWB56_gp41 [Anoxybacillus phage A403]AVO22609.1 hypothetical protein [Anoxybacillus phage A403]